MSSTRYAFIFSFDSDWVMVLYEGVEFTKYYSSSSDFWEPSLRSLNLFLEDGGSRYWYELPSYDAIDNLDIFKLEDKPIESIHKYLRVMEKGSGACSERV